MLEIYVSIGNSDNKLSQAEWSAFCDETHEVIVKHAHLVYGTWYSLPHAPYQNACWCFKAASVKAADMRYELDMLRQHYRQDAITWAVAATEFIS